VATRLVLGDLIVGIVADVKVIRISSSNAVPVLDVAWMQVRAGIGD
jgi:hypothetical protein